MENNLYGDSARESTERHNDWQHSENRKSESQDMNDQFFDLRSAEANGYGTEEAYSAKDDETQGDDTEHGELADNDDDAATMNDWGNVDPQSNGMPSGNDPSAPGSAV